MSGQSLGMDFKWEGRNQITRPIDSPRVYDGLSFSTGEEGLLPTNSIIYCTSVRTNVGQTEDQHTSSSGRRFRTISPERWVELY